MLYSFDKMCYKKPKLSPRFLSIIHNGYESFNINCIKVLETNLVVIVTFPVSKLNFLMLVKTGLSREAERWRELHC